MDKKFIVRRLFSKLGPSRCCERKVVKEFFILFSVLSFLVTFREPQHKDSKQKDVDKESALNVENGRTVASYHFSIHPRCVYQLCPSNRFNFSLSTTNKDFSIMLHQTAYRLLAVPSFYLFSDIMSASFSEAANNRTQQALQALELAWRKSLEEFWKHEKWSKKNAN